MVLKAFVVLWRLSWIGQRWALMMALLLLQLMAGAQKQLLWKWQLQSDSICIDGHINGMPPVFIKVPADAVKEDFEIVYQIIDQLRYKELLAYDSTIRRLSDLLVKPFEKQIAFSAIIVVSIDSLLIRVPIEFLRAGGKELALVKPVVFCIGKPDYVEMEQVKLKKGLLIRDPTADPEDACATTFASYPTSTYRSAYHVIPSVLKPKRGDDFLLVSTHGFVDSSSGFGRILFKESALDSTFFLHYYFKLIYLDACQQGINWSYLSALSRTSKPVFFLGPIVSNDSGESSTRTINGFFTYLKQTGDPVRSLWQTRRSLFRQYSKCHRLDVVNKAYIFRIYKF